MEAMAEGTLLYHIPCDRLWSLLAPHPAVASQVQSQLHQRLVDAYDHIKELTLHDVRARLAHALARLAQRHGGEMILETHAQLAALIGARQEDVTRALHHLAALNLIACRPHRRGIVVLDIVGLARLS